MSKERSVRIQIYNRPDNPTLETKVNDAFKTGMLKDKEIINIGNYI